MKKKMLFAAAAVLVAASGVYAGRGKHRCAENAGEVKPAAAVAGAAHNCGDCPAQKETDAKKCPSVICPEKIEGVKTVSKNIAAGVELTMTAAGKETIAKLQELTLVHYGNKETMDEDCPGRVEGAESKVINTASGVKVLITGKTAAVVKKIQAASASEHGGQPCPEAAHGPTAGDCPHKL